MKLFSYFRSCSRLLSCTLLLLSFQICLFRPKHCYAETYNIDPEHSRLEFKVKHMGIGWVYGKFTEFSGSFEYDPKDLAKSKVDVLVNTLSLASGAPKRDRHLASADFLDAMSFREIRFFSNRIEGDNPEEFKAIGALSIKNVQKEVTLNIIHGGSIVDPWGNPRCAFSATTKINRKDFGLKWNRLLETGAFLVGEEVEIYIDVQGIAVKDLTPKLSIPK